MTVKAVYEKFRALESIHDVVDLTLRWRGADEKGACASSCVMRRCAHGPPLLQSERYLEPGKLLFKQAVADAESDDNVIELVLVVRSFFNVAFLSLTHYTSVHCYYLHVSQEFTSGRCLASQEQTVRLLG